MTWTRTLSPQDEYAVGDRPADREGFAVENNGHKPRLLFFQWNHQPNAGLSDHLIIHMNDHVKCLGLFFDVKVINHDCNYVEMCDLHEPDIAMFESGYQTFVSRRPKITNIRSNNQIPKIGFHNADSWSNCRSGFLSDMEHWDIDTFFSICTTTSDYIPALRDRFFIWPNFIDSSVFRDYGLEKTVPVMISGKCHEQYPWRQQVFPFVSEMFPTLVCPAFHDGSGLAHRSLSGVAYARALNSSYFAPTCGTMAKEVVRKHFEIPGAKSCLVAEASAALKAAGFRHMENCVLAKPEEVIDSIDYLVKNRELLNNITDRGYELVHSRHTMAHRTQIYQWFLLQRDLRAGETIVQLGPFENLVAQPEAEARPTLRLSDDSLDRVFLRRANYLISRGDISEARENYDQCLRYVTYLPEAHFGTALCDLHEGKAAAASATLARLIEATVVTYGAADPDPIEWAYFLVALAAQGHLDRADELCGWYPDLRHRHIAYVHRAVAILSGREPRQPFQIHADRKSVHEVPERTFEDWTAWLTGILLACGQPGLAARLGPERSFCVPPVREASGSTGARRMSRVTIGSLTDIFLQNSGLAKLRPGVPPTSEFKYFSHVRLNAKRWFTQSSPGVRLRNVWRRVRGRWEIRNIRRRIGSGGS